MAKLKVHFPSQRAGASIYLRNGELPSTDSPKEVGLQPQTRSSTQVSSMDGRNPTTEAISTTPQGLQWQQAGVRCRHSAAGRRDLNHWANGPLRYSVLARKRVSVLPDALIFFFPREIDNQIFM